MKKKIITAILAACMLAGVTTPTTGSIVTTYGYNDANMVLTMATTKGNGNVTNFVYNYYTDGNQRTKVDTILMLIVVIIRYQRRNRSVGS